MEIRVQQAGRNLQIGSGTDLLGTHRMAFGDDVFIGKDGVLAIVYERPQPGPMISIGNGVWMNKRCYISAANEITIGDYAIFAPNVYLADSAYEYRDIGVPIMKQGLASVENRIRIGEHAWLGINAVVYGDVTVGKGSVIGANSVVTKSVPDYCVAGGQPARVLRAYDDRSGEWPRVTSDEQLEEILTDGRSNVALRAPDSPPRIPMLYAELVTIG